MLEPLFIQYNVSLVLNGHDHIYERIKPQNGIPYFVEGSSGQLREGDLRKGSPLTGVGNDTDRTFMLMEIDGDDLTFNTIARRERHRLRRDHAAEEACEPAACLDRFSRLRARSCSPVGLEDRLDLARRSRRP